MWFRALLETPCPLIMIRRLLPGGKMSRPVPVFSTLALLSCSFFCSTTKLFSQTTSPVPANQPCVILKRMGPADEVTSHLYSFGIRGKQFQFEGGKLPESVKFHGRLTDNDVRTIQSAGGRVEIVEAHFTAEELEHARKSCGINDGTNAATPATVATASGPSTSAASVTVKSTPDGADITVDGKFSGSTPSKLQLTEGAHVILVEQSGYTIWQRTVTISAVNDININAVLVKSPGT
jgi:hypothetical protein